MQYPCQLSAVITRYYTSSDAALAMLIVGVFVAQGCSGRSRIEAPAWNAEVIGKQAIQELDADLDGAISERELEKAPGVKSALNAIDTDNNKLITRDEIAARISAYKDLSLGMVPYVCSVHVCGKPLEGATVRLIPESFLSGVVSSATGISKPSGYCVLRADGTTTPGIRVGIYRVEITSEQMSVPAKYNSETVLGVEVSPGLASGSRSDIDVFDVGI